MAGIAGFYRTVDRFGFLTKVKNLAVALIILVSVFALGFGAGYGTRAAVSHYRRNAARIARSRTPVSLRIEEGAEGGDKTKVTTSLPSGLD